MRSARVVAGLTCLFLFAPDATRGQAAPKPEFEVASVKPIHPNRTSAVHPGGYSPSQNTHRETDPRGHGAAAFKSRVGQGGLTRIGMISSASPRPPRNPANSRRPSRLRPPRRC